jgi:hypothetical protein
MPNRGPINMNLTRSIRITRCSTRVIMENSHEVGGAAEVEAVVSQFTTLLMSPDSRTVTQEESRITRTTIRRSLSMVPRAICHPEEREVEQEEVSMYKQKLSDLTRPARTHKTCGKKKQTSTTYPHELKGKITICKAIKTTET